MISHHKGGIPMTLGGIEMKSEMMKDGSLKFNIGDEGWLENGSC
jgi:hypothetical protein